MQGPIRLVLAFLGMNPFFLAAIALCTLGTGIYLQANENRSNLLKADALLSGPPDPVGPEAAAAAAAAHPFGEVTVRAQLDMTMDLTLSAGDKAEDRVGYAVPLLAADATDPEILGVLLYDDKALTAEAVDAIQFGPRAEAEGSFGPVLMLNGMVGDLGEFDRIVAEAFASEGRVLPEGVFVLREFQGNRAGAYNPAWPFETTIFGMFAWAAGAIGLYALVRSAIHIRRRAAAGDQAAQDIGDDDGALLADVMAASAS